MCVCVCMMIEREGKELILRIEFASDQALGLELKAYLNVGSGQPNEGQVNGESEGVKCTGEEDFILREDEPAGDIYICMADQQLVLADRKLVRKLRIDGRQRWKFTGCLTSWPANKWAETRTCSLPWRDDASMAVRFV